MKKSDFLPPDSLYQRYAKLHVPDTAAVYARMHATYSCREKIFLASSEWQIQSSFALPWLIALEGLSPLSPIGWHWRGSTRERTPWPSPPHILPSLSHWPIALEGLSPLQGYVAGAAYNAGVKSGGRGALPGASRLVAGGPRLSPPPRTG